MFSWQKQTQLHECVQLSGMGKSQQKEILGGAVFCMSNYICMEICCYDQRRLSWNQNHSEYIMVWIDW